MADIDYVQILLGFLGGSGLVGLVVTYLQFREERKERARDRFSGLVMTQRLRLVFGTLALLFININRSMTLLRELTAPEMLMEVTKDPRNTTVFRRKAKEARKWAGKTRLLSSKLLSRLSAATENGDLSLIPNIIYTQLTETVTSQYNTA
jgi:hypothetical protein